MPEGGWCSALAEYLGMWMAMMVPMMLPPLIPMLSRRRRLPGNARKPFAPGLTTLVGLGYFAVWAALGAAVWGAGVGLMEAESRWALAAEWMWAAPGLVLLAVGGVQLTAWKARQLALWRSDTDPGRLPASGALDAVRHGIALGGRCSLACGNLMVGLLVLGMMNPAAMALVTLAIWAERMGTPRARLVREAGLTLAVIGLVSIIRGYTLPG
jgi:predicted metal-binding membrane protein